MHEPDLHRYTRTAIFQPQDGTAQPPPLRDAMLMHASASMWVLSGFERLVVEVGTPTDFAQTWVLSPPEGDEPQGWGGPPLPG